MIDLALGNANRTGSEAPQRYTDPNFELLIYLEADKRRNIADVMSLIFPARLDIQHAINTIQ